MDDATEFFKKKIEDLSLQRDYIKILRDISVYSFEEAEARYKLAILNTKYGDNGDKKERE